MDTPQAIRNLALFATGLSATNALSIFGIFCVLLYGTRGYSRISFRRGLIVNLASIFVLQFATASSVWFDLYYRRFLLIEAILRLLSSAVGSFFVLHLLRNIRETVKTSCCDDSTLEYEALIAQAKAEKRQDRRNLLIFASNEALRKQSISMQRAVGE